MKKTPLIALCAALSVFVSPLFATSYNYTSTGTWESIVSASSQILAADNIYLNGGTAMSISSDVGEYLSRITIGNNSGAASLTLTNGATITVKNRVYVGDRSRNSASVLTIYTGSSLIMSTAGTNLWVGNAQNGTNANGTLYLRGGTLNIGQNGLLVAATTTTDGAVTSTGSIYMTGGTFVGGSSSTNITVAGSGANNPSSSGTAIFSLTGGYLSLSANNVLVGANGAAKADARLTVSSLMDKARFEVASAFMLRGTSSLTIDFMAGTDWKNKNAILEIGGTGGTLTLQNTAAITLNFDGFDVWSGAATDETITITVISYSTLNKAAGATTEVVGLDDTLFEYSNLTWGATGLTIDITFKGIPEPSVSAGLLGLLAVAFVARRRR